MKQGLDQNTLLSKLSYIKDNRKDIITNAVDIEWGWNQITSENIDRWHSVTDHARMQLAAWLGLPLAAMRQFCSDNTTRDDWDRIVNTRIVQKSKDQKRLLRITDGKCEGLVSTRFNVGYDAHLTFPVLLDQMESLGLHLDSGSITETHSYMKLLSPKVRGTVLGQEIQFGVCHSTSDFGLARHNSALLILILTCLNGMVVAKTQLAVSRTHRGREMWINDDGETDGLPDPVKIREEIEGLAKSTSEMLNSDRLNAITAQIEEIGKRHIGAESKKIEKYLKSLGLRFEIDGIVRHYNQAADYSVWGLSNAITRAAQDTHSYDNSVAMERAGWNIFTNPPAEYIPKAQMVVEGALN